MMGALQEINIFLKRIFKEAPELSIKLYKIKKGMISTPVHFNKIIKQEIKLKHIWYLFLGDLFNFIKINKKNIIKTVKEPSVRIRRPVKI